MKFFLSIFGITVVGGMGGLLLYVGVKDWLNIYQRGPELVTPFRLLAAIAEIIAGSIGLFFAVTQIIAFFMELV
jgi:hypothetical protein